HCRSPLPACELTPQQHIRQRVARRLFLTCALALSYCPLRPKRGKIESLRTFFQSFCFPVRIHLRVLPLPTGSPLAGTQARSHKTTRNPTPAPAAKKPLPPCPQPLTH